MTKPDQVPESESATAAEDANALASTPEEQERVAGFAEAFEQFFAQGRPDSSSWIGVGLDGTLAYSEGPTINPDVIGQPIPDMVARVRDWTARGHTVKVFTARAADETGAAQVEQWLRDHELPEIEVTCEKDLHMVELWDTRTVQVIANTGQAVGESQIEQPRQVADTESLLQSDVETPEDKQ